MQNAKTITFTGATESDARAAAANWVNDFTQHGPIHMRALSVAMLSVTINGSKFIAKVEYIEIKSPSTAVIEALRHCR